MTREIRNEIESFLFRLIAFGGRKRYIVEQYLYHDTENPLQNEFSRITGKIHNVMVSFYCHLIAFSGRRRFMTKWNLDHDFGKP